MIYNLYGGIGIDLSQLDNSASDILNGKKYVGSDGTIVTGNIPTLSSNTVTLTTSSSSTTLSPGYLSSNKEINVRSTSVSAYTGAIPIASFSAEATVKNIAGSNSSFITTVTGAPTNILAGFIDTGTIGSATDATQIVGGSYILPGKSLGIKYKAGATTYTYKVNSTLSNEEISNIDVGFANNVSTDLDISEITPSANKVISKITVPENVGLVIYNVVPETSDNNIKLGEDNHILKGWNAIVGFKSDANTIKKGYITGTYEPSLQPITSSIGFSGGATATQTITPGSGYVGLSSVTCVKDVRAWVANTQPTGYTNLGTTSALQTGYYVKITADGGQGVQGAVITGTGPTPQAKPCTRPTSFAVDSPDGTLSTKSISPDSGKYLTSVTGVPSNMSISWVNKTSAMWKTTIPAHNTLVYAGKASHLSSAILVVRMKFGDTNFAFYVTPEDY